MNNIDYISFLVVISFLIYMFFFYKKLNKQEKLKEEEKELLYRGYVKVVGSEDLKKYLDNLSINEKLIFKSKFISRYNNSPFADYYDIKISELEQLYCFNKFLIEKNLKYDDIKTKINLIDNNNDKTYKYLSEAEYLKRIENIEKRENEKPDNTVKNLSKNFRFGY